MVQGMIAGVDLGGTKILAGLFDQQGQLMGERLVLTRPDQGLETVLDRMVSLVGELMQEYAPGQKLEAVVVGAPGPLNSETGLIYEAPNLKWKQVPLREVLQGALQVPVGDNDANLAALGNTPTVIRWNMRCCSIYSQYRDRRGIIIDGQIYRGIDGGAGEFGHVTILPRGPVCGCGNHGCLEALASGTAIARAAREEVSQGRCRAVREAVKGRLEDIDARLIAELATGGDAEAGRIMEEAIGYLGIGVANLVNLFNPRAIVIGGGLSGYPGMLDRVRQVVRNALIPVWVKTLDPAGEAGRPGQADRLSGPG